MTPSEIRSILETEGFDVALKALNELKGYDREIRLLAVAYAKSVEHLMKDERSKKSLEIADHYANGLATEEKLEKAKMAAEDTAMESQKQELIRMLDCIENGEVYNI